MFCKTIKEHIAKLFRFRRKFKVGKLNNWQTFRNNSSQDTQDVLGFPSKTRSSLVV